MHEAGFGQSEDATVARNSEGSTAAMPGDLAARGGTDALCASCPNLRPFGILVQVEAATGLPVVSSDLALIRHMLRMGGHTGASLAAGADVRVVIAQRDRSRMPFSMPDKVIGTMRPSKISRIRAIEWVWSQYFSGTGLIHKWPGHCSRARISQVWPDSAFQCSFAPPG